MRRLFLKALFYSGRTTARITEKREPFLSDWSMMSRSSSSILSEAGSSVS